MSTFLSVENMLYVKNFSFQYNNHYPLSILIFENVIIFKSQSELISLISKGNQLIMILFIYNWYVKIL